MKSARKIAVIIVDMQDFFLDKFSDKKRNILIQKQSKVIDFCIEQKTPLIFLEYKDRGVTTKLLSQPIKNSPHVEIVTKDSNGGFTNTNLDEILKNKGVEEIVLMGINASGCVQDTAIGALNRGYKIVTSGDVIASATKRDSDLATSKKWYSQKGLFFENADELLVYLFPLFRDRFLKP
jgi:nicotinamidase-related amidase